MGMPIAEAVFWWLLKMEAQVQSQDSPCEICHGQSGTGTVPSKYFDSPLLIFIPPMFYTLTHYLRLIKYDPFVATIQRNSSHPKEKEIIFIQPYTYLFAYSVYISVLTDNKHDSSDRKYSYFRLEVLKVEQTVYTTGSIELWNLNIMPAAASHTPPHHVRDTPHPDWTPCAQVATAAILSSRRWCLSPPTTAGGRPRCSCDRIKRYWGWRTHFQTCEQCVLHRQGSTNPVPCFIWSAESFLLGCLLHISGRIWLERPSHYTLQSLNCK